MFYCEAANDIADVLLKNEEVLYELLPLLARFHEAFFVFSHYLGDRDTQPQMTHDELSDVHNEMTGESALMANLCGPMAKNPRHVHMLHLMVCYFCN